MAKDCPRCKKNPLHPEKVMNALSRRNNKTYICSACGIDEAVFDLRRSQMNVTATQIKEEIAWLNKE